jgi:hypothetical protein
MVYIYYNNNNNNKDVTFLSDREFEILSLFCSI